MTRTTCRRRELLAHFGDKPREPPPRRCCDVCSDPERARAAAGRFVHFATALNSRTARGAADEEDEAAAARAGRKRRKGDPHDTGLVDDDDGSDAEADGDAERGIARAGGGPGGGGGASSAAGQERFRPVQQPRRGAPKLSKEALGARLAHLIEREQDEDEDDDGESAAARLRARLG